MFVLRNLMDMNSNPERAAMEEAVRRDPKDLVVRKMLADWLDEFSPAEAALAAKHRGWTEEKQIALEYMQQLILHPVRLIPGHVPTDQVVDEWLDNLSTYLHTGKKFPILFYYNTCRFIEQSQHGWAWLWLHFKTLTGVEPGPLLRKKNLQHNPFTQT